MKKKILIAILAIVLILFLIFLVLFIIDTKRMEEGRQVLFSTWGRNYDMAKSNDNNNNVNDDNNKDNDDIKFALTMDDKIEEDTVWCGTFQLIWNDLKNDLAKQDIIFKEFPDLEVVKNLNKGDFKTDDISEESYYKIYGNPSIELKNEIERAIKEKFNETSDILDDFDWSDSNPRDYFLYCMLKKEFEFPIEFNELGEGTFADKYNNIEYFGLEKNAEEQVRNQIEVLYYINDQNFAIKLKTKQNDEVILAKGITEDSFKDIYNEILKNEEQFEGEKSFTEMDEIKVPKLDIDEKKRLSELENKIFSFSDGTEYEIDEALQTIKFELDEKGGKIKSEAGMMVRENAILLTENIERNFYLDDEFIIFLKEEDKDKPYFAAKINDIIKFE